MEKEWGNFKLRRISLRFRFLLLLVLLFAFLFVAVTAITVRQERRTLKQNLANNAKSFASLATAPLGNYYEVYQSSGSIKIQLEARSLASLNPDINQIEVYDTAGRSLFSQNPADRITVSSGQLNSLDPSYIYNASGDLTAIVQPFVENYGIHRYNMVYGVSYTNLNRNIWSVVLSISLISLFVLLVSLALAYWLINRLFLGPVVNLSHSALTISKGNLNQPIQLLRNDEIGDLANSVDTMAKYLKEDIIKLRQEEVMKNEFMMITSHNLRTPLAILDGYVDIIKSQADAELMKLLEPLVVNINRLRGFAEDVLTISTFEAGTVVLSLSPVQMAPFLNSMAKEFALQARQKRLDFNTDIKTNCTVNLSQLHFRSALLNLLDNAYKFTPQAGKVSLEARDDGRQLIIKVADSGIGISPDELPKLFTKFHRSTATLKYNYEGSGIGLYLAKLIVEKHGGSISVESVLDKGSVFTITLPVWHSASG